MKACPHCGQTVFRKSACSRKLKARTRILVLHKGGGVEINCHSCGKGVLLPLVVVDGDTELRKAGVPKLVARKA